MKTTIKTYDGHYLTTEEFGTVPKGLLTARGTDASLGAWQEFTVRKAGKGHIGLFSHHGFWVAAELDGTLVARTQQPEDWTPAAWEAFEVVPIDRGGFALKTAHGKYVHAEYGGGGRVLATKDSVGPHEAWTAAGGFTGDVISSAVPLQGQLRVLGRSFGDDTGPRTVMFGAWFTAIKQYRDDRDAFRRQLDALAEAGWQGARIFLAVGGNDYWWGREVAPVDYTNSKGRAVQAWPDYDEVLRGTLEEFKARQLKVNLTTGDMQYTFPGARGEVAFFERCARIVRDVGQEVVGVWEIYNEGFQNSALGESEEGIAHMSDCIRAMKAICPAPVYGLTDFNGSEEPAAIEKTREPADVALIHGARSDDRWPDFQIQRAFGVSYWDGDLNHLRRPIWQGEPNGPGMYVGINGHAAILGLYAMHLIVGQGTVYNSLESVLYDHPLDHRWGFLELPPVLALIPQDAGQWARLIHGARPESVLISATGYVHEGGAAEGPARVDQAYGDRQIAAVIYGGKGRWRILSRRPIEYDIIGPYGIEASGSADAGGTLEHTWGADSVARVVVGTFR